MPLSNTALRAAKPKKKTYLMTDGEGMYLEITPSGGKWWRFKYRFDDTQKRISLGTYPDIGLKEAREKRQEARRLLATRVDPSKTAKCKKLRLGRPCSPQCSVARTIRPFMKDLTTSI